jgi:hypothetical protein
MTKAIINQAAKPRWLYRILRITRRRRERPLKRDLPHLARLYYLAQCYGCKAILAA